MELQLQNVLENITRLKKELNELREVVRIIAKEKLNKDLNLIGDIDLELEKLLIPKIDTMPLYFSMKTLCASTGAEYTTCLGRRMAKILKKNGFYSHQKRVGNKVFRLWSFKQFHKNNED